MDLEHAVICTVVSTADYTEVMAQGIKPGFFYDIKHRRVFELIGDHLLEYRRVPGIDVIQRAFPSYGFQSYPEPVAYYAEQLRGQRIYKVLMDGISGQVQPLLTDEAPDGYRLLEVMGKVIFDASVEVPFGAPVDSAEYIVGYMTEELKIRAAHGYLRGISTGFDTIDRAIGGYQKEQLVTFVGLPKHGKSTMMLASALAAKRQGYRVLFVTFEMSVDEQMDRLGSLLSGISLNKILSGEMVHNEQQEFFRILRQFQTLTGFRMVHDRSSMMTLTGVNQTVMDNEPDIVFIDGMYMMDDEQGEPSMSPRAITNITRGMKRLAQSHKIPFVVSTQALHSRSRGGLKADSVGYSSSFVQDSDTTIGVYKLTPTISQFKALAVRSGRNFDIHLRIDWDRGLIEEMDPSLALAEIQARSATTSKGNFYGSAGQSR